MLDRRRSTCCNRRRQRGRKDEARRIRPYRVTHFRAGGDIAAHDTIGFCKGTVDNIDTAHQPVTLCHTRAARAVHANRVDLIDIGQGVKFVSQITDRFDRAEVAIHRINRLERDQFRSFRIVGS